MKVGKVVVFGLPGAFTPTCSSTHLPGYEEKYDQIIEAGAREIYCVSVNDSFVMDAWAKDLGISKVKMVPDGNLEFTDKMNMRVSKSNIGFGDRSWRYSMIVNNGKIEKLFTEDGKRNNCPTDPFRVSDSETMLKYLKSNKN
jgi:peroxiredoxin